MQHKLIGMMILAGMSCTLSGCITGGTAFGLGAGSLHETVMTEKKKNAPPPVYGPPQIIYRIDDNRYFTLENYTRCENGQTFYNNKAKGIHFSISPGSGYLFKGRLFWLSSRDDYLAFPFTRDTDKAVCAVSDKGCKNLITVTVDGGKTLKAIEYSYYIKDPTSETKYYDMIVTDDAFYMIEYHRDDERVFKNGYTRQWKFYSKDGRMGASGPLYIKEHVAFDVSKIKNNRFKCDRTLEPGY
ncbi:hypothetical protein N5580_05075 [Pantoea piersonii]|uniref:Tli3-like domain-containing protein n=1 Tax=Pantoea piersonii TaxID=2364647 RepID=A0AAJ5QMP4_9GAMM|nr:hypothetical protein [Pantoea piersonii]WBG91919.1 hypothetical protein N5580_05075 [Pantoea piersonii]